MKRHRLWNSLQNWPRRINRYVTASPSNHDLRSSVQGALNRLDSHHGNESLRLQNVFSLKTRCGRKRSDLAPIERLRQRLFFDFAIDGGEFEVPVKFHRQIAHDVERPFQMGAAARVSGRADDHRNARTERLTEYQAKVSLYTLARSTGLSGAKVVGAGIGRARITPHEVCAVFDRADQSLFTESRAEVASGSYSFQLASQHASYAIRLVGCAEQLLVVLTKKSRKNKLPLSETLPRMPRAYRVHRPGYCRCAAPWPTSLVRRHSPGERRSAPCALHNIVSGVGRWA